MEWQRDKSARWARVTVPESAKPGFTTVRPSETGVLFTNTILESRSLTNQIYLNGSGVAAGDVDGDGRCDLFFTAIDRPLALFRNHGSWRFEDATRQSGLPMMNLAATGAALADLDCDGDLDLVFNTVGLGTHVFINDGAGHFSARPVLNGKSGGMSLALADVDGDADLDLYIANYRTATLRDEPNTRFSIRMVNGQPQVAAVNGRPVTDPDLTNRFTFLLSSQGARGALTHEENGEPDAFFRNDGKGNFTPIPAAEIFLNADGSPAPLELDWGLSVMFRDINQDGAPDLYICNDFRSPDRLWLNDGHGHFRPASPLALRHTSLSSMGVDFADINRDGRDDFFVADMLSPDRVRRLTQMGDARPIAHVIGEFENRPQYARNTLFLNGGDGTHQEIAQFAGLEASDWSWTPIFLDVDLDGLEDLLVSNGFERDNLNIDALRQLELAKANRSMTALEQLSLRRLFPRLATPNLAFRNRGGLRFEEAGRAWGFDAASVSTGMALADLDNDGDQDIVINNVNDAATLLRNDTPADRVAVRLKGQGNTRGIGARVELAGAGPPQAQEMISGGRYLSSDDATRTFAAARGTMSLRVRWRSGAESFVDGVVANRIYEIDENAAAPVAEAPAPKAESPIRFEDVSGRLNHTHHDEPFDDFARQPLLPAKLSQLGPGVSWFDLDGDGWEDLLIPAGRGGAMGAFRNDRGTFAALTNGAWGGLMPRDQTAVVGMRQGGAVTLLAGSANYEDRLQTMGGVRIFNVTGGRAEDSLPAPEASAGPLALLDIDGDGDLDLFVGGRVVPGKYPGGAPSWIHKNTAGQFARDEVNSGALAGVGMVSGAVCADLNGDGWTDLALACDWGPVRVFINEKGRLRERTEEMGLGGTEGLWNSVAAGDFDGDGRIDLAAGNVGSNSRWEGFRAHSLQLAHGDFDGDGIHDVIEASFDPRLGRVAPIRGLDALGKAMPPLRERFSTAAAFAEAGVEEIIGGKLSATNRLSARRLESTVFLNRGGTFEAKTLPSAAQFSPVFGIVAADFDNDGALDLFLAQNSFAVPPEVARQDAGWGLVLRGDGSGNFTPLAPGQSGVRIAGEQRGAAAADFDHDGRIDFVVGQNGGETKLFRNLSARPGLRVSLRGGSMNPDGVGAMVRVRGATNGPWQVVACGAGYWSSSAPTLVVARPPLGSSLEIRWPGGETQSVPVPPDAQNVAISRGGKIENVP